ncbi:uncharacterized protein BXIN_1896 [Babesia sp. Xinjiang]|uniref:uncharacterized protein n=1 Tax=Babesia sp. Xinjiang TaxID=462227 RepID=UPI000A238C4B|nr:uncharacterized protein BXIN_1896 [Babesia sp. Xinjiang]ORM40322.1 hypothetical protein BXIN_1896 [Babesia sp. Xinjiang]
MLCIVDGMARHWNREETEEFIRYARRSFNEKDRHALENKLRGSAEHGLIGHTTHEHGKERFQKDDGDIIGECVDELWHSEEKMATIIEEAIENASTSYEKVKTNGLKDGLKLTSDVDKQLISTAWKHAFTKSIIKFAVPRIREVCAKKARDAGLCAISEEDFNDLAPETIYSIINERIGLVKRYVSIDVAAITREMEVMQFCGVFKKNSEAGAVYQNCSTLWLKSEHLSPQHQRETLKVVEKIKRIPFELCKKCKIMLQVISYVRVVLVTGENAEIKRHTDELDCGVMFTVLYFASIQSQENVYLDVQVRGVARRIKLEADQLVVLGNDASYELKPINGKIFIVEAWITGAK